MGQSHIIPDLCYIFPLIIHNWQVMERRQAADEMNDFSDAVQLLWWSSQIFWLLSSTEPAFSHRHGAEAAGSSSP